MARTKIALIGAGIIGGTLAHLAVTASSATSSSSTSSRASRGQGARSRPGGPVEGYDAKLKGTQDYVRLSESPSYGKPICLYDPTSTGAQDYADLAKELTGQGEENGGTDKGIG